MKHSDINHLRRLLGWVRCEIGQSPDELIATVRDIMPIIGPVGEPAQRRLVEAHDDARRVPKYIRNAVKALEQAVFSANWADVSGQTEAVPEFIPVAARKLGDLQERGMKINGYALQGEKDGLTHRCLINLHGMVCWFNGPEPGFKPAIAATGWSDPCQPDSLRGGHIGAATEKVEPAVAESDWISVNDRLPQPLQSCDWLFPVSEIKGERWMLCGECIVSASVPGRATHWRPAQGLPPAHGVGKAVQS